MVSAIVKHV